MQFHAYIINYKTDAYDKDCINNFIAAAKTCLGIEYDKVLSVIDLVHEHVKDKGGKLVLVKWSVYPQLLEELFRIPYKNCATFFQGLTLDRKNKLSLEKSIWHSDSLNRHLYRPILIWNVNGEDLCLLGDGTFGQSIVSLCLNAFTWRKYPIEWKNECFNKYIEEISERASKILEDYIETIFRKNNIVYDRNIEYLKKWHNRNVSIRSDPGEIDFLFLYKGKLYIAESKNQMIRYCKLPQKSPTVVREKSLI
jgi:hypothetical protein